MTGKPFEQQRRVDQIFNRRVIIIHRPQLGLFIQPVLQFHPWTGGHLFRDCVHGRQRNAERSSHVANYRTRAHRAERYDLGDVFGAVFITHVLNDAIATLLAQVDVEVGHLRPLGVHEPLEQQSVLDGINAGNPQ